MKDKRSSSDVPWLIPKVKKPKRKVH